MGLGIAITVGLMAAVVVGVLIGRYYAPDDRALRRSAGHAKAYLRALNHVLGRETQQAIDELRDVVNENVDDPDPYFALGSMFRARGEWERAIRVHQSLAIREGSSRQERQRAQYELGMDFRSAGMPRRATKAMETCLALDARHEGALRTLAGLYEEQGQFGLAATMWSRLRSVRDEAPRPRDHHLAVAAAQEAIADGDLGTAASRLREAEQLGEVTAHFWVATAELAMANGDLASAVEPWCAALAISPDLASVVAPRLQEAVGAELARAAAGAATSHSHKDSKAGKGLRRGEEHQTLVGQREESAPDSRPALSPQAAPLRVIELLDELAEQLSVELTPDAERAGAEGKAAERSLAAATNAVKTEANEQVVVLGLAAAEIESRVDGECASRRLAALVARYPDLLTVRIIAARTALAMAKSGNDAGAEVTAIAACRALIEKNGPLDWAAQGAWRCEACGHLGENLFWRCDRCRRWGTVQLDVAFLDRVPRPLPRERRSEARAKRAQAVGVLPTAALSGGQGTAHRHGTGAAKGTVLGRVGQFVSNGWSKARGAPRGNEEKRDPR